MLQPLTTKLYSSALRKVIQTHSGTDPTLSTSTKFYQELSNFSLKLYDSLNKNKTDGSTSEKEVLQNNFELSH